MTALARPGGLAVVTGASGGLGQALLQALEAGGQYDAVLGFSRGGTPRLDITDEASIAAVAAAIAAQPHPLRLVLDATGFLHGRGWMPEKSLQQLDPAHLAHAFAVNAIGPALLMKHLLPLLPREGRAVFATLSARIGSIGDNATGGWYAYRASKAALNQLVRTAAVELRRSRPAALCVALHPGTVDTPLSGPFSRSGLEVQPPALAAARILQVIGGLDAKDSGGFVDHHGVTIPW
jgi:NAD(P)-dependent dehydrogenase (short-subunit alcohol dehydrogenase family)